MNEQQIRERLEEEMYAVCKHLRCVDCFLKWGDEKRCKHINEYDTKELLEIVLGLHKSYENGLRMERTGVHLRKPIISW